MITLRPTRKPPGPLRTCTFPNGAKAKAGQPIFSRDVATAAALIFHQMKKQFPDHTPDFTTPHPHRSVYHQYQPTSRTFGEKRSLIFCLAATLSITPGPYNKHPISYAFHSIPIISPCSPLSQNPEIASQSAIIPEKRDIFIIIYHHHSSSLGQRDRDRYKIQD